MLWIIERILERLLLKSAIQMGSQKEAEMDLKHVQSRMALPVITQGLTVTAVTHRDTR